MAGMADLARSLALISLVHVSIDGRVGIIPPNGIERSRDQINERIEPHYPYYNLHSQYGGAKLEQLASSTRLSYLHR